MAISTKAWNLVRETVKDTEAAPFFAEIEADVERLIQELQSYQASDRELRNALGEPSGAEFQRR